MKKIIAGLFFLTSSAFAASNIGVVQGDAVTFSSMVVTGNVTLNGTCTGSGCGSGGGGSTNGTVSASQNGNVAIYTQPGSTTTVGGTPNLQVYGSSIVANQTVYANGANIALSSNTFLSFTDSSGGTTNPIMVGFTAGGQYMGISEPSGVAIGTQSNTAGQDPYLLVGNYSGKQYGSFGIFGSSNNTTQTYSGFTSTTGVSQSTLWALPKKDGTNGQSWITDGAAHTSFASFVPSINSAGNSAIVSSVTFAAIGSAALSQVGNTITISASGGGASSLGVNYNGVSVTTPTAQINVLFPLRATANSSTATLTLDNLSLSTGPFSGQLPATSVATGNLGAGVISSSAAVNSITPTALSAGAYPNITGLGPITSSVTFNGAAGGSDLYISSNVAVFTTYVDSNTSTAQTINWNLSNRHYSRLTGNVTYTFIAPPAGANLFLDIDTGNGSFTATWPGSVIWAGGSAPTITTAANNYDKINCDYLEVKGKYLCAPVQAYH